jgi:hypothetical protein
MGRPFANTAPLALVVLLVLVLLAVLHSMPHAWSHRSRGQARHNHNTPSRAVGSQELNSTPSLCEPFLVQAPGGSGWPPPYAWPVAIPTLLHFVVRRADAISVNMRSTARLFMQEVRGAGKVIIWTDGECRRAIQCLPEALEPSTLLARWDGERHGPYRADLCRYVLLYVHGGLYVDDDLEFIAPPGAALMPNDGVRDRSAR